MAPVVRVTTQDLLDALVTATNAPEDARTVRELSDEHGMTERAVRNALRVFQAQGRLTVHRVFRAALDGRNSQVAAYTIAPPKAKPKR